MFKQVIPRYANKYRQASLTNEILTAISNYCKLLDCLTLSNCPLLESEPLAECLISITQPLTKLDLSGNNDLTDIVLEAAAKQHGKQLSHLNINGLDEITSIGLAFLTEHVKALEFVDFSWIRDVDDEFFHTFMLSGTRLQEVRLFGCSLISRYLLDKEWTNRSNRKITLLGNEYD